MMHLRHRSSILTHFWTFARVTPCSKFYVYIFFCLVFYSVSLFHIFYCVFMCHILYEFVGLEMVHAIERTNRHQWLFASVVLVTFCSECTKKLAGS